MGKATIVSDLGEGEYTARIIFDTERAEAEIVSLNRKISAINEELSLVGSERSLIQSEIDSLQADLDALINSGAELDALFSIVERIADITAKIAPVRLKESQLKASKLSAQKKITFIESGLPADDVLTLWCADYSEGLSGEVGTIEVNGTLDATPIIYPNEIEGSAFNQARDSQIQPIVSSGAAAVYFNRAIFPAWQKWLPTYRIGTITSKSGDLCSVDLDQVLSDQELVVNQAGSLTNIPIEYMNQNGTVFEAGDRVVVKFEFQDWDQPKVIGFESNPKPEDILYLLNDPYFTNDSSQINSHDLNGALRSNIYGGQKSGFAARNLARSGKDLYFFYQEGGGNIDGEIIRVSSSGSLSTLVNNCDNKFCVNGDFIFYHEQDYTIFSRKIIKIDRLSGALVDQWNVTIPNVNVMEEMRPFWVDCNDQYFYWRMQDDETLENPTTYICRSDHFGQNQEVVGTWPPPNMPSLSNSSGSWRGMHVTKDRIYIPRGRVSVEDPLEVVPIVCFVYDLDLNFVGSFGVLTRGIGLNWLGGDYMRGFAANENVAVWLADEHNGLSYTQVWDRVIVRNGNGDITSETWEKRVGASTNLDSFYDGILGGICL